MQLAVSRYRVVRWHTALVCRWVCVVDVAIQLAAQSVGSKLVDVTVAVATMAGDASLIKSSIFDALRRADPLPGAFAGTGDVPNLPSLVPAISVRAGGVGRLGLPLCSLQGAALVAAGTPAPHGAGTATVLDTAVRRALQIDAHDVDIAASWTPVLQEIVVRACRALGLSSSASSGVEAKLYKLLVYEPGGHFVSHRDTEKEPGMFGTLIVSLPSTHEGGALTVRHGGKSFVADFSGSMSGETFRWAALYADCEHSLSPVTAGLRVVLAYNLVRTAGNIPAAPYLHSGDAGTRLAAAVAAWVAADPDSSPLKLILPLEHRYTKCNLSFDALKRRDAACVALLTACPDLEVRLVLVTRHVTGMPDGGDAGYGDSGHGYWGGRGDGKRSRRSYHDGIPAALAGVAALRSCVNAAKKDDKNEGEDEDEEDNDEEEDDDQGDKEGDNVVNDNEDDDEDDNEEEDSDASGAGSMAEVHADDIDVSTQWLAPDGTTVESYLSLELDEKSPEWLSDRPLFSRGARADEREYEGYTGNTGPTLEYWYYRAVAVIWPVAFGVDVAAAAGVTALLVHTKAAVQRSKEGWAGQDAQDALDALASLLREHSDCITNAGVPAYALSSRATIAAASARMTQLCGLLQDAVRGGAPQADVADVAVLAYAHLQRLELDAKDESVISAVAALAGAVRSDAADTALIASVAKLAPAVPEVCISLANACPEALQTSLAGAILRRCCDGTTWPHTKAPSGPIVAGPVEAIAAYLWGRSRNVLSAAEWTGYATAFARALCDGGKTMSARLSSVVALSPVAEAARGGEATAVTLVKTRMEQLEEEGATGPPPSFSWCQPNVWMPEYPAVEAFMRGPTERATFRIFKSIHEARRLERMFRVSSDFRSTISSGDAVAATGGAGQRAFCTITKSNAAYTKQLARYAHAVDELKTLRALLQTHGDSCRLAESVSAVAATAAAPAATVAAVAAAPSTAAEPDDDVIDLTS